MSGPGWSVLQQVDLISNVSAWLKTTASMKLGGFFKKTNDTLVSQGMYMNRVESYSAEDGKTVPVGFSTEEIDARPSSGDATYKMTQGNPFTREVSIGLSGRLALKNAGDTDIEFFDDIAPHPSGVQIADTTGQIIIGKSLMPAAAGKYGIFQVDLVNTRVKA